ncbi:MAG: sulfotransferase [Chloroflexota bacterium]
MFKLFGFRPEKILKAELTTGAVYSPFQYFSDYPETIFQLVFSDGNIAFDLFFHFDHNGHVLGKTAIGDIPEKFWTHHSIPKLYSVLQRSNSTEESFNNLLRRMHFAAGNSAKLWEQAEERDRLKSMFSAQPIVIGGCGRSGTSLLLSILGAHPSILALQTETYAFYPRPLRSGKIRNQIQHQAGKETARRWCEKTPKNVLAFDQINTFFDGQVKIIHVVRDGRSVVTSHHPNHIQKYWVPVDRWIKDVEEGLKFKDQTHIVRYEDLVTDPPMTLEKICRFIREPFDAKMLDFQKHTTVKHNIAWGAGASVRPISAEHVQKWQAPEHAEVISELMANEKAVNLLEKFGYIQD